VSERRGRLLVDGALVRGRVSFEDGRITALEPDPEAPADVCIVPGLVDLHVHGYGGHGPSSVGDGLAGMAHALARAGTTAFQPTLFPEAPAALGRTAAEVWKAAGALEEGAGARVVGLHLEGPFVNPRSAGALPRDGLADPSPYALSAILGAATGDGHGIRTMTLAPELEGAPLLVEELVRSNVRVSLGHSLATAAEARAAARQGALGATHLYNAMGPVHHRKAGLASFVLSEDGLIAELIGDLVHVGPEAIRLALRARGTEGLALVSDALPGAGSGCDVFHSHGFECRVADGAIWIDDPETGEPRLTGAATTQLEAIRRLTGRGVVGLEEALTMATATPARALGLEQELGHLRVGARADLLVLHGPDLILGEVLLGGQPLPPGPSGSAASGR